MKTHVWKEWREHRVTTLVLAAAIPALLLLCKWTLPSDVNEDEVLPPLAAFAALAVAAFAYGADIVPGERRRGRLAFLRRLPAGARAPFAAKACLVAAAYAGFPAYAYVCAGALLGFPAEVWPHLWWVLGTELVVAAWMFAVSCWLPRGALALPAAALLIGMIVLPIAWLGWFHGARPTAVELRCALWWGGAGAAVVAALTFVRGSLAGVLALAAVATPLWAYAGVRTHDWITLDLEADDLELTGAFLSPSGRSVYVTAWSGGPVHALRVDLETGAYTTHGGTGDFFVEKRRAVLLGGSHRSNVVGLVDGDSVEGRRHWAAYHDADTFAPLKSGWSDHRLAEVEAQLDDPDLPPELEGWHVYEYATGYKCWRFQQPSRAIYDKTRRRMFFDAPRKVTALPGVWLAHNRLYDPDTKRDLGKVDWGRLVHVLADGRVLMLKDGELAVIDPDTRERTVLRRDLADCYGTIHGVVYVCTTAGEAHLLRVAPDLDLRTIPVAKGTFVFPLSDRIAVLDHRRIVRLDFETGTIEPLFPR